MNHETSSRSGAALVKDAFIPLLVLALSYVILVSWQVSNALAQREAMQTASSRQEPVIDQSHQAQAALQKLASDVIEAAQTDDIAKAIVAKYGMQIKAPATPAASPAK